MNRNLCYSLLLMLAAFLLAAPARSDTTLVDTSQRLDTAALVDSIIVDTVLYRPGEVLAPFRPVTDPENLELRLPQNPTSALLKSLIVPGLGQVGNRRYTKAVIFLGLDVWFVGSAIHYGRQASDLRRRFESASSTAQRNDFYDLYQDRRDERNKFTWFAVIVTFLSMFDAYVDAHLSGFPSRTDKDPLSLAVHTSSEGAVAACLSVSF